MSVKHIAIRVPLAFLATLPPSAVADSFQDAGVPEPATETLGTVTVTDQRVDDGLAGGARLDRATLSARRGSMSDAARLLDDVPGVSSYGAGGISSLPVVHGLADDRLRTQVDGMDLMPACPNHMNPALSFIDPSKIAEVEVFAGVTPVSVGGDSIGGTIQVKSAPPEFARDGEGVLARGWAGVFRRSNGDAHGNNFGASLASRVLSLRYSESNSSSDNYWAAGDFKVDYPAAWKTSSGGRTVAEEEVGASEYQGSKNRELSIAARLFGGHIIEFGISEQKLDYEGFPNQRMDMVSSVPDPEDPFSFSLEKDKPANVNQLMNLRYTGQYGWGELEAQLFHQDLRHHMDMLPERYANMMMPMDTEATTDGGALKASIGLDDSNVLRVGYDFQRYRLDDWWPPIGFGLSMCCDDFWNIRDGRRDREGMFAELETQWSPAWLTLFGARGDMVSTDAGDVQGYSYTYDKDANRFNALDHAHENHHVDVTLLTRYTPDGGQTYEAGIAQKMRSPNLYELYPWSYNSMAAVMNNFVGDGNGYIGNPNLKPETAHTLSVSGDWHNEDRGRWNVKVTGYWTYVSNFINARRYVTPTNSSAGPSCDGTNMTTTNCYVLLEYVNHDARLYGVDLSGHAELGDVSGVGSFSVKGMLSYVRGEDRTTGDDLYHIMPDNAKFALVHKLSGWTNTVEVEIVDDKKRVSQVRNEVQTPGYTLLNLRSSYEWKHARLDLALENALNKFYLLPLGGAYLGQGNAMSRNGVPWGMSVPGPARSFNVALSVNF